MKGVLGLVAVSAVLSAGLVAGLVAGLAAAETPAAPAWSDPPAKTDAKTGATCRDAAWPRSPDACAARAPARQIRVIALDGREPAGSGLPRTAALR